MPYPVRSGCDIAIEPAKSTSADTLVTPSSLVRDKDMIRNPRVDVRSSSTLTGWSRGPDDNTDLGYNPVRLSVTAFVPTTTGFG